MLKGKGTRMLFIILVVIVVVSLAQGANGQKEADKPITIRFATYFGSEYPDFWPAHMKFNEMVNEKGKGKVFVNFYPSETLLKANQLLPGLMGGAVEAVSSPLAYWHGTFPITQGLSLPRVWAGGSEQAYKALSPDSPIVNFLNEILAKKNIFIFFAHTENNDYLWTKNKAVKTPADAKGLKIRASGIIAQEVSSVIGASSVALSSAEIYTALQRGTVDATLAGYTTILSRGLEEQIRYVTNYTFDNFGPFVIGFRKDWYDKLPKDVRDIIKDAGRAYYETFFAVSEKVSKEQIGKLKKRIEFINLTPQETEAFDKLMIPMRNWWVSRKEIGEPGKKLLELMHNVK